MKPCEYILTDNHSRFPLSLPNHLS